MFLPIALNLTGKKILLIGGGRVACHKLKTLLKFTQDITVIGNNISPKIKELGLTVQETSYHKDLLSGFFLVYACTDNKELNLQIKQDAQAVGILVNVVDTPKHCDFISPAIYKNDNMSVAVSSNGTDVKKSIAWRNQIKELFE